MTEPEPTVESSPGRVLRFAVVAAIAVAAFAPYVRVLEAPYVFDDFKLVRDNPLLRVEGEEAVGRLTSIFDIASEEWESEEIRENYRPLRFLSYWVDYRLSKAWLAEFEPDNVPPLFFHVQNVLWHVLNALLVASIAGSLFRSGRAAFLCGLLFAVHPIVTEAVTFVSGRRDVLSTFFFLASIALYLRSDPVGPLRWTAVLFSPVLFGLGFLAKEMVITLPAILFALELARRAKIEWRRVLCHAGLWAIAGYYIWVTVGNEALIAAPVGGSSESTVLTASRYVVRYLALAMFPVTQSLDYSYDAIPPSTGWFSPKATFAAISIVAVLSIVVCVAAWKRRVVVTFGLSWFLVGLTPVLQFVPIPERFAERFVYLPSIGVFLLAAGALGELRRRQRAIGGLAIVVLLGTYAFMAVQRNEDWRTRHGLWESATLAQPRCARAHLALGNALKDLGDFEDAAEAYSRALDLWAESPEPTSLQRGQALQARMFRGGVYAALGVDARGRVTTRHLEAAVDDLREVLASTDTDGKKVESSPEFTRIHYEIAAVYLKLERRDDARRHFDRIIEIGEPAAIVAQAHYWLGKIGIMDHDLPSAVAQFRSAMAVLPADDPNVFSVALELADMMSNLESDHDGAWALLERLERSSPPDDVRVGILLRKARILDRQGVIDACLDRLEEALSIDPYSIPVLATLAGIEANLGRFDDAEERYRVILERDRDNLEVREAYKALKIQQGVGGAEQTQEAKNADVLRGLVSRAKANVEDRKLLAARDVYSQLLQTAGRLQSDEGVAIAYCGLAEIEQVFGRPKVAFRNLQQAEKILPQRPETLLAIALYHVREGVEPANAQAYLERYMDQMGDDEAIDPRALFHLAELLAEAKPLAAVDYLRRAREAGIRKYVGDSAELIGWRIGQLLAKAGLYRDAHEEIQKFVEREGVPEHDAQRVEAMRLLEEEVVPRMLELEIDGAEGSPDDREGAREP